MVIPFNKSFADHHDLIQLNCWDNKKNGDANPKYISKYSHKKYWFTCDKCSHCFNIQISKVTIGHWCHYCSNQLLCSDECSVCFKKSFASYHDKIKLSCWLDESVNPRSVFLGCNKKYPFKCNICNHIFAIKINHIYSDDAWCPYCSDPPKKLCVDDKCELCRNKSFAGYNDINKVACWNNQRNNCTPRDVFKYSHKKYWFTCNICLADFSISLAHINNDGWCSYCHKKTEYMLIQFCNSKFGIENVVTQYRQHWCTNNKIMLPFDVCIFKKIIIELDGRQHFVQVSNWNTPESIHHTDIYKMACANINGFSVIRILQEDVYHNKYNWTEILMNAINLIVNSTNNMIYNIYLCNNNEYDSWDKELSNITQI